MDGGEFVCKWLVAVEWNILVCVSGFAIDIKAKGTVGIVDYCNIQHSNLAVLLNFDCPFNVRVDGVEVVVQWMDVGVVNGTSNMPQLQQSNFHSCFVRGIFRLFLVAEGGHK